MINTKSIYYDPVDKADGFRILVTRYYPRGVKRDRYHIWLRDLAPSRELLTDWKNNFITEKGYRRLYIKEMKSKTSKRLIAWLQSRPQSIKITLLCLEKSGEFCHRHILKELIEH